MLLSEYGTRREVMYCAQFMVYTTSASNLTALAVFKLDECFCEKGELH